MPKISSPKPAGILSIGRYSEWSLKRKLFIYMFFLTILLLAILAVSLAVFGRTGSGIEIYQDALEMQMEVYEKDISTHFDHLAASAIALSEDMTIILEDLLDRQNMAFSQLTNAQDEITALQDAILEPLRQKLLQTNCSGAFILFDATVNDTLPEAAYSKTGLYLQISGYQLAHPEIILYRGCADIGKTNGIMPHRKWRLEFRTDLFPDYAEIVSEAYLPLANAYRISKPFTLPGTSDQVLLLSVPMCSADGTFYGICGYEISASYFTTYHEQPSVLPHLTCILASGHENILITKEAFHCGGTDGYFYSLPNDYAIRKTNHGLSLFMDDNHSYIGIAKSIALSSDGEEHLLAVMVPKTDYDRAWAGLIVKSSALIVLILFFTVSFCRFFSRRFLAPLLTALEQIKSDKRSETTSDIPEILDLIAYLNKQEKEHVETIDALEKKHQISETERQRLQTEYEKALSSFRRIEEEYSQAKSELNRVQTEIDRLAYSRKNEIDPADYEYFLNGIQTLTKTERNLFEHYLSGKSVQEILELTGIKESTLKYHNHNLLGKLGVSSRKQMLRYAEIMRQQNEMGKIN